MAPNRERYDSTDDRCVCVTVSATQNRHRKSFNVVVEVVSGAPNREGHVVWRGHE